MQSSIRRAGLAGTVLVALVLAGCSAPAEQANPPASEFVGRTLEYAIDHITGSVASLDVSHDLGIRVAANTASAAAMTVIASCYASESQLNVAVIASADVTPEVAKQSRTGRYDPLLSDCEK